MRMLSLLLTVILVHSKAVIEHEIIFTRTEKFLFNLSAYREHFYNVPKFYISSYTWTTY
jgi:hypothetical protein